jgi:alpha-1,3-mannosyltransferase
MRLLHVTPVYAPSVGGIEEVVSNLAHRGRQAGIEVDIVHVARGLKRGQSRQGDMSVMTLPRVGHRMLGWTPGLGQLASQYDLLHVHDPQVGTLTINIICGVDSRVPAVLSTHGGFFHSATAMTAKRMHARVTAPLLLRRYSRILASSRTDFATFRQYSPDTVLVENGVDTTKFGGGPTGRRDLRRWIYWGRFARNKRLDSLIRLVAALARRGVHVDLALCGIDFDGTLADLRSLVADLNVERQIAFRIGLDDAALRAEIATRAVFALPSEYEGFGLSMLEAMGAGLIPICRDAAPMNVLGGNAAVLLDFDDEENDLVKVRQLLTAPADGVDRHRTAAAAQAATFDWDTRFQAFLQQYQECARRVA